MSSDSGSIMRTSSRDSEKGETSSSGSSSEPSPTGSTDSGIAQPENTNSGIAQPENTKPRATQEYNDNPVVKKNIRLERVKSLPRILSRRKRSVQPKRERLTENKEIVDRERRLQTFMEEGWNGEVSMEDLADAGFYFSKQNGRIVCYKCSLDVSDWKKEDVPKARHKKLSSHCEVVKEYIQPGTIRFDARISSPANISEDVDDGRSGPSNPGEFYKSHYNRLVSYVDWPLSNPVDRYDLASTGLYSIREQAGSDAVKCFACYKVIRGWKLGDRPKKIHASLSPDCPFVNNKRTGNKTLTDAEKTQIASLFLECEGGSLPTKFSGLKNEEASSEKKCPPSEIVEKDHFVVNALYPKYYHESKRLQSFQKWPVDHCQQPPQLAGAGFYKTGRDDEVQCFYCGGRLDGWEPQDIPLTEHVTHYPKCKWALKHIKRRDVEEETKFQPVTSSSHQEIVSDYDALIEELEKLQERSLCKVCLDGDADILFLPCKHLAACKECTERLELCPICRSDIDEIIHVFMS